MRLPVFSFWSRLSFRYKVPLALAAVILATELVVTLTLMRTAYVGMQQDTRQSARELNQVLSLAIRESLVRDDLWRVYEALQIPLTTGEGLLGVSSILILDPQLRVYVASDPRRFAVGAAITALPTELQVTAEALQTGQLPFLFSVPGSDDALAVAGSAIMSEDSGLAGYVLVAYDVGAWRQRLYEQVSNVVLISIPGLALLLTLGWLWGNRIARPLLVVAQAIERVGHEPAASIHLKLRREGSDEIATLGQRLSAMLAQLKRQEVMEREMVAAERLAAVGRVSAGVAHEINNPLGGMLNALDTLEKHGTYDELTTKTIGLTRRGLQQIRGTVSALLVESRLDSTSMTPADWEDLRLLIAPQVHEKRAGLLWDTPTQEDLPLPAHLVRQLTLNLLLNAKNAVDQGGSISCTAITSEAGLRIEIANSGDHIPEDALPHLFEPFTFDRDIANRSSGLGLWVTYQIVTQLNGGIEVVSEEGYTAFTVLLPFGAVKQEQ